MDSHISIYTLEYYNNFIIFKYKFLSVYLLFLQVLNSLVGLVIILNLN